jgi:hypothetical protein
MVGLGGTAQNPAVVPATLPIALGNTSLLPTGVKIVGGTANPQAVGSLFPYASGYQVWAGNCNDADPEGVNASGTRYWPTSSRPTPTNVTPGATTNVTLSLRSVNVLVRRSNGSGGFTNVAGATVVAQHAVAPGCSAVQSYTLGVTASNGRIISGLPYGTWTIIANSTSGGNVSISPTGTSAVGKTVTVP